MSLLLGEPAPSFDEPLEMLMACHGRIRAQCKTLLKLAAHMPEHGADSQAQQAARNIMRYFDVAGRNHHADEEIDLFPQLLAIARAEQSPVGEAIQRLLAEHQQLDALWAQLRPVLAQIAEGQGATLDVGLAGQFDASYRSHTANEEAHILPYAASRLDQAQLAALSAAMVARRTSDRRPA